MGNNIRNWVIKVLAVTVVVGLILLGVHKFITPLYIFGGDKEVKVEEKKDKVDKKKSEEVIDEEPAKEEKTAENKEVKDKVAPENKEATIKEKEVTKKDSTPAEDPMLKLAEKAKTLDYGKIASEGYEKAKKLAPEDRDLRKWIIRLHLYATIQDVKSSDDELLEGAKATIKIRTAFNKVAKDKYGVTISDTELNQYIKSQTKNTAETAAFAKVLGMEVDYFNNDYERDQYSHQLMLQKVAEKGKTLVPRKEGESDSEYTKRFNNLLNKEVEQAMK